MIYDSGNLKSLGAQCSTPPREVIGSQAARTSASGGVTAGGLSSPAGLANARAAARSRVGHDALVVMGLHCIVLVTNMSHS